MASPTTDMAPAPEQFQPQQSSLAAEHSLPIDPEVVAGELNIILLEALDIAPTIASSQQHYGRAEFDQLRGYLREQLERFATGTAADWRAGLRDLSSWSQHCTTTTGGATDGEPRLHAPSDALRMAVIRVQTAMDLLEGTTEHEGSYSAGFPGGAADQHEYAGAVVDALLHPLKQLEAVTDDASYVADLINHDSYQVRYRTTLFLYENGADESLKEALAQAIQTEKDAPTEPTSVATEYRRVLRGAARNAGVADVPDDWRQRLT